MNDKDTSTQEGNENKKTFTQEQLDEIVKKRVKQYQTKLDEVKPILDALKEEKEKKQKQEQEKLELLKDYDLNDLVDFVKGKNGVKDQGSTIPENKTKLKNWKSKIDVSKIKWTKIDDLK